MKKLHLLLTVLGLTFSVSSFSAHDFIDPRNENVECRVVGVLDGDTIDCLKASNEKLRIRLSSIDAPEKRQAYGTASKNRLSDYIYGKTITASIENKDRYGRYIAELFLPEYNYSVNYLMVQDGMAWAYERYVKDRAYITAQQQAKAKKVGLWRDKNPIEPQEFRRKK